MKIIDLLNRIANNGFIPIKIKYHNTEYFVHTNIFGEFMIIDKDNHQMTYSKLNDEVEVIEYSPKEDKIEKLRTWYSMEEYDDLSYANYNFEKYYDKINELIDKVNEMSDKE